MAGSLTPDQLRSYQDQGYVFPIAIFSEDEAHSLRREMEALEAEFGRQLPVERFLREHALYISKFVASIAQSETILDCVESILGPDLLVWNCGFFTKEAGTPNIVSWHQDLTYWGLNETDEVTAWVALSPATVESGCMRFLPGSHKQEIVPHRDTFAEGNMLSRGQEIAVDVPEGQAVEVVLRPGEMSLHHGRIFHASGPNNSADRRLGLAIRFIKPSMKQVVGRKDFASLVRGQDTFGHFELIPPAKTDFDPAVVSRCEAIRAEEQKYYYQGVEERAPV